MRRQALDNLRQAIEANTQRRSLDQLRAQGKQHVRVVSSAKVLEIIKAIVADIVDREVGELTQRDRARIVTETKTQFDRVMKMQGEQDKLIAEQRALVERLREQLVQAEGQRDRLQGELERTRSEQAEREASMLAGYQERVQQVVSEAQAVREHGEKAARVIRKLESRLETARTAFESMQREQKNLVEERDRLLAELAAAREQAGESKTVGELRGELADMKAFLKELEERNSGVQQATLSQLMEQLTQRQSADTSSLEEKFSKTLDASLDKITKTMELATSKPIDTPIEATEALVAKLFDHDTEELSSNLDELEVEVRHSTTDIGGSLAALRAMRAGNKPEHEEPEPEEAAAAEGDPLQEGNHGPETEKAAVSESERAKISASMERLKAVRGGEEKES